MNASGPFRVNQRFVNKIDSGSSTKDAEDSLHYLRKDFVK